jgi:hypothetical protein
MKHTPLLLLCLLLPSSLLAQPEQAIQKVKEVPGLVAFWTFADAEGEAKKSLVNPELELQEHNGPIPTREAGPFGTAIKINQGQWLSIPREKIGPLDIHGADAQVTVVAWIERTKMSHWQAIAGVWDESRKKRQYCLFLNAAKQTDFRTMTRTASSDRFQGHVSSVGGPTPGEEFCITYATSGETVAMDGWQSLVMTYDGKEVRLYLNGKLSAAEGMNPFPYREGLFDGGDEGADFTVGSVSVRGKPGNFLGATLGGLAVFNRALNAEEIEALPR